MAVSMMVSPEEIPAAQLSALDKAEVLTYESVTNYARAAKGAAQLCVMCGRGSAGSRGSTASGGGGTVVIPRQNKDVCRDCDKAIWQHESTAAYFKWCKGCKNFLQIGSFSQKLDAAKCDKCRERGRTSYLLKKRYASAPGERKAPDDAAAVSLVALSHEAEPAKVSSSFGCSLLDLREDDSDEDPRDEVSAREAPGLLFELAAIHSTILKLEQRADLVAPLEERVAKLRDDLERERKRADAAEAQLAGLLKRDSDETVLDASKRPRVISFDAASNQDDTSRD